MKLLNTNNCRSITAIQIERFIKKQKSRKLIEQLCDSQFTKWIFSPSLTRPFLAQTGPT